MIKVIFICHGNICRSPVASILFNKYIKEMGLEDSYSSISRATSREEIGNDIYPPMKRVLVSHHIDFNRHYATQITRAEFEESDYIFYMDHNNLYYLNRLFGSSNKFVLLRKYLDNTDIEDPWYTDRFEYVYKEINEAVKSIINRLNKEKDLQV